MRTVSQISTILGTAYLANAGDGQSAGTSIIPMLNLALPRLYEMGAWKSLMVEVQIDCTAGYAVLPPDYECVIAAMVNDAHVPIQSMLYEYQSGGPGIISQPASAIYGIIDEGYVTLMSDAPDDGIEELIFTSTSAFASGDIATITYTDSEDGYTQVALPLNAISGTFATSSTHSGGAETKLNSAANPVAAGFVVGMGVTISGASVAAYNASWRVTEISATGGSGFGYIVINKIWAATDSGTYTGNATLYPANTISSVESLAYASLPARTVVDDADDTIYAILPAGDGVSQYRRYKVPQPEEDTASTYTLQAVVKRAFIPIVATSDHVYLDNLNVLRHSFLAIIAEDHADLDTAGKHWGIIKNILGAELATAKGGIQVLPNLQIWGDGIQPMPYRY